MELTKKVMEALAAMMSWMLAAVVTVSEPQLQLTKTAAVSYTHLTLPTIHLV